MHRKKTSILGIVLVKNLICSNYEVIDKKGSKYETYDNLLKLFIITWINYIIKYGR